MVILIMNDSKVIQQTVLFLRKKLSSVLTLKAQNPNHL